MCRKRSFFFQQFPHLLNIVSIFTERIISTLVLNKSISVYDKSISVYILSLKFMRQFSFNLKARRNEVFFFKIYFRCLGLQTQLMRQFMKESRLFSRLETSRRPSERIQRRFRPFTSLNCVIHWHPPLYQICYSLFDRIAYSMVSQIHSFADAGIKVPISTLFFPLIDQNWRVRVFRESSYEKSF